jgi:hypothetical protein
MGAERLTALVALGDCAEEPADQSSVPSASMSASSTSM